MECGIIEIKTVGNHVPILIIEFIVPKDEMSLYLFMNQDDYVT